MFVLFLFQVAFEDPEVQGIYLLTDGKPVSLHFMPCPQLNFFAEKSNYSTRFASMLQNQLHVFCCPFTVA